MSTTEYSPAVYTGDPQQIFIDAIAAKVAGHLTDEQFNTVMSIPVQTAYARPVASDAYVESVSVRRARAILTWLRSRPVLGTFLTALTLFIIVVVGWAIVAAGQLAWLWLQTNIVGIGVVLFILAVVTLIFKSLSIKDKHAAADLARARQPAVVHRGPRGDDR